MSCSTPKEHKKHKGKGPCGPVGLTYEKPSKGRKTSESLSRVVCPKWCALRRPVTKALKSRDAHREVAKAYRIADLHRAIW